jgi:Fe-S-cluster containining protein
MVKIHPSNAKLTYIPFKDALAEMTDVKLKDKFNFECQRCGSCCSDPPRINLKESSRMAEYLGLSRADFFNEYLSIEPDSIYFWKAVPSKKDGHCIFLKDDKSEGRQKYCEVYEAAPRQCRSRPLFGGSYVGDIIRPKAMKLQINHCPGIGKGKEYTVKGWIREKGLVEMWQENLDYRKKLELLMLSTRNENELMSKVIDMFIT